MGGIRDIFKNIFGKEQLENELNKQIYAWLMKGSFIPLSDSMETYVDSYASNAFVYPVVKRISNSITGVRWNVVNENGDIMPENHELYRILRYPNPLQTQWELIREMVIWRLLTGNRYIYTIKMQTGANAGRVGEVWNLPAAYVDIEGGNWTEPVTGYAVTFNGSRKPIPADSVRHSVYFNPKFNASASQLYGQSPLAAALTTIQATKLGYDSLNAAFSNGGPPVIITGTKENSSDFTQEQAQLIQERFNRKYAGAKNNGKWHTQNTPIDVHEIGMSPVDLNTLEMIKLSLRDICNIYSLPSVLFNDNQFSTYNNMREAVKAAWTQCYIPELEDLKADFNIAIASPYAKATGEKVHYEYDLSDVTELNDDKSVQAQSLSTAWWLTPNQRLVAMGFEADLNNPMMDMRWIPMGLIPMNEAAEPAEPIDEAKFYDRTGYKY